MTKSKLINDRSSDHSSVSMVKFERVNGGWDSIVYKILTIHNGSQFHSQVVAYDNVLLFYWC